MSEPVSRRRFLATGAVGAAAVSAATLAASTGALGIGGLLSSASAGAVVAAPQHDLTAVGTDVVAHVRNASTGEVLLMVGTSEALIHDRALVSRLLAGARSATKEA